MKTRKGKSKLILSAALLAAGCGTGTGSPMTAKAAPMRRPAVNVVILKGRDVIDRESFKSVAWPEVAFRFEHDLGLPVRLKRLSTRAVTLPSWVTEYDPAKFRSRQHQRLNICRKLFRRRRWRRNQVFFCVFPPMRFGDTRYLAGLSSLSAYGSRHNLPAAMAQCENMAVDGKDRRYACAVIVAHETAHILGATHLVGGHNLMDPGAGAYWDTEAFAIPFLERTKEQINKFLRNLKRRK